MTPYFLEDEKREMIEKTEHLTESELSKECIEKLYMYGWKKKKRFQELLAQLYGKLVMVDTEDIRESIALL